MAKFICKVIGSTGKQIQYIEEASGKTELLYRFHERNIYCIEIKEVGQEKSFNRNSLNMKELMVFCKQLGAMLNAGISISAALDTLYSSSNNKRVKTAVMKLYEKILSGQSVSKSMNEMNGCFPSMLIYMIEVGENSGNLALILKDMANYYQKEFKVRKKIQNSMMYPIVLSIVSILVVVFLLIFVLPKFISLYNGIDLPLPTRILISISDFIINKYSVILIIAGALSLLLFWLSINETFKYHLSRIGLKIPVMGKLMKIVLTSRFCNAFSVLLHSGIGIMKALDTTIKAMDHTFMEYKLREVMDNVSQGIQFSDAISHVGIFDPMMVAMVVAGEETGSLDELMSQTGEFFESQADEAAAKLLSLIEPLMIVIFGFLVAFIVISIMLPMFNMYENML